MGEKSQRRVADYPLHRLSNQPVFQTEIPPTASVQRTDRAKKKVLLRGMFELIMRRPARIEIPGGVRRKTGVDGGTKQVNTHTGKRKGQTGRPLRLPDCVAPLRYCKWPNREKEKSSHLRLRAREPKSEDPYTEDPL